MAMQTGYEACSQLTRAQQRPASLKPQPRLDAPAKGHPWRRRGAAISSREVDAMAPFWRPLPESHVISRLFRQSPDRSLAAALYAAATTVSDSDTARVIRRLSSLLPLRESGTEATEVLTSQRSSQFDRRRRLCRRRGCRREGPHGAEVRLRAIRCSALGPRKARRVGRHGIRSLRSGMSCRPVR
jgi:hypothetical protein